MLMYPLCTFWWNADLDTLCMTAEFQFSKICFFLKFSVEQAKHFLSILSSSSQNLIQGRYRIVKPYRLRRITKLQLRFLYLIGHILYQTFSVHSIISPFCFF